MLRPVNGESSGTGLLWARVVAAVGVAGGLLALVAGAYISRGFDDASRLFLLLQGVILSTLAYLFATQATDRAEQAFILERRQTALMEGASDAASENVEAILRELIATRGALARLLRDPEIGHKVQGVLRADQEG
jgi:hypothetical protein